MSLADRINENFRRVIYHANSGATYRLKMKAYRAIAAGFEELAPGQALSQPPSGFKPRRIHFINRTTGQRTTLPWADADNNWLDQGLTIPIDGIADWVATGRSGEELTYP